ncbi:MAG: amidohydrolase family protein [Pseudomonadota bacterium]
MAVPDETFFSRAPVIDAHHHLWDLGHCDYPWLMTPGVKRFFGDPTPIQKNYLPADFVRDAAPLSLAGSVHIQVGVSDADCLRETEWLAQLHQAAPHLPTAIVGFADLTQARFPAELDAHQKASAFRGVRQIIGRHPSEDRQNNSAAALDATCFITHLRELAARDLSFDLQLTEHQYARAFEVFAQVPELKVAICHVASPWDQTPDGFVNWCDAMTRFAQLPNCALKFSGFGMFRPDWTATHVAPYLVQALELFGAKRLMVGSNFPVDKLYGDHNRMYRAVAALTDRDTYTALTFDTASHFYRLGL